MGWFSKKSAPPDAESATRRPAGVPVVDATLDVVELEPDAPAPAELEPDAAAIPEPAEAETVGDGPEFREADAESPEAASDAESSEAESPEAAVEAPVLRPLGGASRAPRPTPGLSTLLALEAAAMQLRGAQPADEGTEDAASEEAGDERAAEVVVVADEVAAEDAVAEDVWAEQSGVQGADSADEAPARAEPSAWTSGAAPAAAAVSGTGFDEVSAEQARLERERQARREARLAALAPGAEEDPLAPEAAPVVVPRVTDATDRFWGSLGLFGLRAATAMIMFVHGLNGVITPKPVLQTWSNTVLPAGAVRFVAVGVPWLELLIAALLVVGLATRAAGLLLLGLMAGTLALVMWGPWTIFEPGGAGFLGEHELLLAAAGLVFVTLGAGAWSFDAMLRRGREREGLDA